MRVITITSDGVVSDTQITPDYDSISDAVGGWIEHISLIKDDSFNWASMYVNEEGKIIHLPYNKIATALYQRGRITDDFIAGDVIIFGPVSDQGDEQDITDDILTEIQGMVG